MAVLSTPVSILRESVGLTSIGPIEPVGEVMADRGKVIFFVRYGRFDVEASTRAGVKGGNLIGVTSEKFVFQ